MNARIESVFDNEPVIQRLDNGGGDAHRDE